MLDTDTGDRANRAGVAVRQKVPAAARRMAEGVRGLLPPEARTQDNRQTLNQGEIPGALTADHRKVIDYVRQYYQEFATVPPVRLVVRRTGFSLRCLHRLFPGGYTTGVY